MKFYPGYHQPSQTRNLARCFVSINRLKTRKSDFKVQEWIMDSGAFTQVSRAYRGSIESAAATGGFEMSAKEYAAQIARWSVCGSLVAACTQDYMCEPFMFEHAWGPDGERLTEEDLWALGETRGCSVREHQEWTVERYAAIANELHRLQCTTYLMPVLQGYSPAEYVEHIALYESRGMLPKGAYVGVGSVCKRNVNVSTVEGVLLAIKARRPDLQLHGFGLKITALKSPAVVAMLASSDSMAWSDAARKEGGDRNAWQTAAAYAERVEALVNSHN